MNTFLKRVEQVFARVLAVAVGLIALAATLFFSAILFAVLLAVAAAVFVYVWWRSRQVRQSTEVIDVESREIRPPDRP